MTVSELARKAGINQATASKKLNAGKTPAQILEEAESWKAKQANRKTKTEVAPGDGESYFEAQRRKEIALADLRELELSLKNGDLVPVAEVNAWVAGMIVEARNILLRIAPDLQDQLSLVSDPAEINKLISGKVDSALDALSQKLVQ